MSMKNKITSLGLILVVFVNNKIPILNEFVINFFGFLIMHAIWRQYQSTDTPLMICEIIQSSQKVVIT